MEIFTKIIEYITELVQKILAYAFGVIKDEDAE